MPRRVAVPGHSNGRRCLQEILVEGLDGECTVATHALRPLWLQHGHDSSGFILAGAGDGQEGGTALRRFQILVPEMALLAYRYLLDQPVDPVCVDQTLLNPGYGCSG